MRGFSDSQHVEGINNGLSRLCKERETIQFVNFTDGGVKVEQSRSNAAPVTSDDNFTLRPKNNNKTSGKYLGITRYMCEYKNSHEHVDWLGSEGVFQGMFQS